MAKRPGEPDLGRVRGELAVRGWIDREEGHILVTGVADLTLDIGRDGAGGIREIRLRETAGKR